MSFGQNLQYLRQARGLTQEQLAERMGVSRQSVSKWESDATLPELDKLTALADLAGCSLDTLLRGDLAAETAADGAGYNAHMDTFTKQITGGVGVIIAGVSLGGVLDALYSMHILPSDVFSGVAMMLCVLVGVSLLVLGGLEHNRFARKNPVVEPFYHSEEIDGFDRIFTRLIVGGVALILASVTVIIPLDKVFSGPAEDVMGALFLLPIAAAVMLFIYGGMQKAKYDIPAYNREHNPTPEQKAINARVGRICGCIMLTATALFLAAGFVRGLWYISWVTFPIGGILCAIVSTALSREDG